MLLNSQHDLLGVVTAGQNPRIKAKFARKFIDNSGKDIPVFYGCPYPARKTQEEYITERDYGFLNFRDIKASDSESRISSKGVEFLVEQANHHPGEITVISIAPNTAISKAIEADHQFASLVKRFYIMAGCVSGDDPSVWKAPEYNLRCDIDAFRKIVESGAESYIVGKDMRFSLEKQEVESIGSHGLNSTLLDLFGRYMAFFEKSAKWLPDPLTVGAFLFPELYSFGRISPVIGEKGQMYGKQSDEGNTHGCVDVAPQIKDKVIGLLKNGRE
jgi:purine nucleosidase